MNKLPESFARSIEKKVVLLKKDKKTVKIGDNEAIYARMCLVALNRINLESARNYDLSPIPILMFHALLQVEGVNSEGEYMKQCTPPFKEVEAWG